MFKWNPPISCARPAENVSADLSGSLPGENAMLLICSILQVLAIGFSWIMQQ